VRTPQVFVAGVEVKATIQRSQKVYVYSENALDQSFQCIDSMRFLFETARADSCSPLKGGLFKQRGKNRQVQNRDTLEGKRRETPGRRKFGRIAAILKRFLSLSDNGRIPL
jgi:hypothetical protein